MGRDEVGVDREPQDPEPFGEIVLPDRRVPVGGTALELLPAPDVVDEQVDPVVVSTKALREALDLRWVEVIDLDGDPAPTRAGDELRRFFDGFWAIVVGAAASRAAAAPRAVDDGTGLAECHRDAAPRAARRSGHHRHATAERLRIG